MIKPCPIRRCASFLEVKPVRFDRVFSELVLELATVCLRVHQVEEGWIGIELVPGANHSYVIRPVPLEWQNVREVRLVDPNTRISYSFSLKAAVLQSYIGCVFEDHVRACGAPSYVLEVLAH